MDGSNARRAPRRKHYADTADDDGGRYDAVAPRRCPRRLGDLQGRSLAHSMGREMLEMQVHTFQARRFRPRLSTFADYYYRFLLR